jgi:hypothetical protein
MKHSEKLRQYKGIHGNLYSTQENGLYHFQVNRPGSWTWGAIVEIEEEFVVFKDQSGMFTIIPLVSLW